jgi:hypothetical protein
MSVTKSSSRVVLIALAAVGTTLWADREARGDTAAGNPVLVIPLAGSGKGPAGDVSLSGEARIGTNVTKAEEFGDPPSVVVSIHLQGITGKDPSGKKYQASGDGEVVRPLVGSDTVEILFSVYPAGSDASSSEARPAAATFKLRLDEKNHGALLQAGGSIGPVGQ